MLFDKYILFNIKQIIKESNMDNIKKIGLTALAGSLVAGTVSAAEMSVTGSATMSYSGGDENATTGAGWTMGDSVTFSASGDVNDIGVTYSVELDGDGAAQGGVDNYSLKFDLGDAGTLTFAGHGGSGFTDSNDDVMPTAHEEPWDVVTGAEGLLIGGLAKTICLLMTIHMTQVSRKSWLLTISSRTISRFLH